MPGRIPLRLVLVATIGLIPSTAFAQPTLRLMAGGGWSAIRADFTRFDAAPGFGFVFGAATRLPLGEGVSLGIEALYVQRGQHVDPPLLLPVEGEGLDEIALVTDEISFRSTSLDVPLLLGFHPFDGPAAPRLYAGPTLSILLDADMTVSVGDQDQTFDADFLFRDLDVGLTLGAGWELGPEGSILVDARYVHGLRDVDSTSLGQRWSAGFLMLGWRF